MDSSNKQEPLEIVDMGNGQKITLLGTAHVSKASADQVAHMIENGEYDAVAVELCPSRHHAIVNPDAISKMDLFQVIKEKKVPMVAANLALGAFQQRMADQFGIKPGQEMRTALEQAQAKELPVLLIDREIGTTLKRVYRNVPWWKRLHLISGLFASVISRENISEEDIERLKEGDILESTFSQFADQAKELYLPLIDERDQYMAAQLINNLADGHKNILAVLGAGHLKGIKNYLGQFKAEETQAKIASLDLLPKSGWFMKVFPWAIVALIFFGFFLGFSQSEDLGWNMVKEWVLINGILASIGALLAGAHPGTIVTAFVAAPLTSLNPTIGVGMVVAAVEIWFRKPNVGDFERMRHDATHWKGWWRNRVTRVFLVFILATLGSAAGTYLAGFRIFDSIVAQ